MHDALVEFGPQPDKGPGHEFEQRLLFAGGGFTTDSPGSLLDVIGDARRRLGPKAGLVHYLAVPPQTVSELTKALGQHGLAAGARVVYEKPFGTSPKDFRSLNRIVHAVLDESHVYRIDHFLGKEATQNLHVIRFANELYAAMWNRAHVESVQIDVPETLRRREPGRLLRRDRCRAGPAGHPPVPGRRGDRHGAAGQPGRRGPAVGPGAGDPLVPAAGPGRGGAGPVRRLPRRQSVRPRSKTDTFVAARLWIDNPRWKGVPFLAAHRQADGREQRVTMVLRTPRRPLTGLPPQANTLMFSLAGDGAIELGLLAKTPGVELRVEPAALGLPLDQLPGNEPLPPYVRLIHDVLLGDRSLFTRPDGLAAAWRTVQPILQAPPRLAKYPQGSWGPPAARKLAAPHRWLPGQ